MVTLRYESAGLGRVDLVLALDGGVVRAIAHVPRGEVAERLAARRRPARRAAVGARPAGVGGRHRATGDVNVAA